VYLRYLAWHKNGIKAAVVCFGDDITSTEATATKSNLFWVPVPVKMDFFPLTFTDTY
jgi:hypothetical protein